MLEHLCEEEVVGHVELHLGAPLHLAQGHDVAHQNAEQVLEPLGERRGMARHGKRPEVDVVDVQRARKPRVGREGGRRLDVVHLLWQALALLLYHLRRQAAGFHDVAVQVVGGFKGGGACDDAEVAVRDEDEVAHEQGGGVQHVVQGAPARHYAVEFVFPNEKLREVRLELEDEVGEPVLLPHAHDAVGEALHGFAQGGGYLASVLLAHEH